MTGLDPSTYDTIDIDNRDDGVVLATLNRPETRNAITAQMHGEMTRLPVEFDCDPVARVLVIAASGRDFCVGLDLTNRPSAKDTGSWVREGRQVVDRMIDCEKPIISVVRGYAVGFGANFALLADVVYAGRSAIFADTHVNNGVGAGDGGQLIWPLLIGVSRAKYYLMTGEKVPADVAERIGLVTFVEDDDKVLNAALALAQRWAAGPRQAIHASKAGITAYLKLLNSIIQPVAMRAESLTLLSEDRQEAAAAFREKRPPAFQGR